MVIWCNFLESHSFTFICKTLCFRCLSWKTALTLTSKHLYPLKLNFILLKQQKIYNDRLWKYHYQKVTFDFAKYQKCSDLMVHNKEKAFRRIDIHFRFIISKHFFCLKNIPLKHYITIEIHISNVKRNS